MNDAKRDFLLVVLTKPEFFAGEEDLIGALVDAGLQKLHIRKPSALRAQLEELLDRLSPECRARMVLHGTDAKELAWQYEIPQIHGPVRFTGDLYGTVEGQGQSGGGGRTVTPGEGVSVSTSLHAHHELEYLPDGVSYAFISPLFDSISKKGYLSNTALLKRPAFRSGCKAIGMGGIDERTIVSVMEHGWDGAAMLGHIWEEPAEAVSRFIKIKQLVSAYEQPD